MYKFLSILLLSISIPCFAQIATTNTGDVLTYDASRAEEKSFSTGITWQAEKNQRFYRLTVKENNAREYTTLGGNPVYSYTKNFALTSYRGKEAEAGNQFIYLPPNQKVEVGMSWNYGRKGSNANCGNWSIVYQAQVKEGPDTTINMNYNNVVVKTLLIEHVGRGRNDRCGTFGHRISILYSPDLDEIILNKLLVLDSDNGGHLEEGFSLTLRAIKTN